MDKLCCDRWQYFDLSEHPHWCTKRKAFRATPDPVPSVVFHLTGGGTLRFDNVNFDSIGPVGANPGVISVEFTDDTDRVVHVPFVEWWEIHYF